MDNQNVVKPDQPQEQKPGQDPQTTPTPPPVAAPEPPTPPLTPLPVLPPEPEEEPETTVLSETPADLPPVAHPVPSRRKYVRWALVVLITLIALGAVGAAAFQVGNSQGYARGKKAMPQTSSAATPLKVPSDATIVSQCTPGEGTQYISPKDIPMGPIYNVWQNKVIGLEYMLPESDIAKDKGLNLPAMVKQYDHVDVMYEAKGHAGLKEPHYHVVVSNISYDQEKKITCGGSSTDVHNMNMGM
jgi:hypothetical protein